MQHTWADFLEGGGLEYLANDAAVAEMSRKRFCELVEPQWLATASDGPSVLVKLPKRLSASEALKILLSSGIRATDGQYFSVPYPAVRLNFVGISHSDAEVLARAIGQLFDQQPR